jgi:hypothetical protein
MKIWTKHLGRDLKYTKKRNIKTNIEGKCIGMHMMRSMKKKTTGDRMIRYALYQGIRSRIGQVLSNWSN